ncbi:toxin-antitoxin system YwqK family antitoxin [Carboxylicivirga sp. RSCT41]|uniref:toxin-antitoxin system YwqK family antitoxin n=1 Tax=Carboxylicivirga agarovorans TaxID=3417570 RepID=UPI003D33E0E5
MSKVKNVLSVVLLMVPAIIYCQAPKYTPKEFINELTNTDLLASNLSLNEGVDYRFGHGRIEIFDVDDNRTTQIKIERDILVCTVGNYNTDIKDGVYKTYIFQKPYKKPIKIWEQTYKSNKLHGRWDIYSLTGELVRFVSYRNDSLYGVTRNYEFDGVTIRNETEYYENNVVVEREFNPKGILIQEKPYKGNQLDGKGTRFYENGKIMESVELKSGELNGLYTYYYPNGQIWVQIEYKDGIPWNVLGSFSQSGEEKESGSLKDGNGSLIYYNGDGSLNEVHEYKNGTRIK